MGRVIIGHDRYEMRHEELQKVLAEHIEKETGRKPDGKVFVSGSIGSGTETKYEVSCNLLKVDS
jgi:hypothetical protein